jgi:hypothetical protein
MIHLVHHCRRLGSRTQRTRERAHEAWAARCRGGCRSGRWLSTGRRHGGRLATRRTWRHYRRLGQPEDGIQPRQACLTLGVALRVAECKIQRLVAPLDLVGKGDCELVGILAGAGLLARSPDPLPVWLRRQGADHWAHILLVQGPLRIHISYLEEQEHARRSTTDCKVKPGGTIPLPAADGIRTRVQGELVASARFHALYIARIKVGVEDQAAALVRAHAAHPRR